MSTTIDRKLIFARRRVYVDGVRLLEARDLQLTHGRAGVLSFCAASDFDNVIVAPAPLATI